MSRKRKVLFSEIVSAGSREYLFGVKEAANGAKYLVITESRDIPDKESGKHKGVIVFEEHLNAFSNQFQEAVEFLMREGQGKAYDVAEIRRECPRAYTKWEADEDLRLKEEYAQGQRIDTLADAFGRQESAIRARLQNLGVRLRD